MLNGLQCMGGASHLLMREALRSSSDHRRHGSPEDPESVSHDGMHICGICDETGQLRMDLVLVLSERQPLGCRYGHLSSPGLCQAWTFVKHRKKAKMECKSATSVTIRLDIPAAHLVTSPNAWQHDFPPPRATAKCIADDVVPSQTSMRVMPTVTTLCVVAMAAVHASGGAHVTGSQPESDQVYTSPSIQYCLIVMVDRM